MGFIIEGLYVGFEVQEFRNEDGSIDVRKIVNVATGRNAYPVYMKNDFDASKVSKIELGTLVRIGCRVYASKAGRITCIDGELL